MGWKSDIMIMGKKDKLISTILRRELILYGTWNSKIMPTHNSEWDTVKYFNPYNIHH
jgi:hypothetical protein